MESYKVESEKSPINPSLRENHDYHLVCNPNDYFYVLLSFHLASYLPIHFFIYIQKELYEIYSFQKWRHIDTLSPPYQYSEPTFLREYTETYGMIVENRMVG